jgi:glycosyltransferase involved in cell wall biosynthesis
MVAAIADCSPTILRVAGVFTPATLATELSLTPGWSQVRPLGWLDRQAVANMMGECLAGLLLFQPLRNHVESQPNKLFEYMAAGLPIVASDFPHWRSILEAEGCGLFVDPTDTRAIASAIRSVTSDRVWAEEMGARGKEAVHRTYGWPSQAAKLLELYERLLPAEGQGP